MRSIFSTCLFLIAVSVFGQCQELDGIEELDRIVGESIKFHTPVQKSGSLTHNGDVIGDVTNSQLTTPSNKYTGRVQWDSSSGHFTLSGLKMDDAGKYKVQNTEQKITKFYQLNVYKDNVPVSKPSVSITTDKYPCNLMCRVARGTGVTLSWYREGEKEDYKRSVPLDPLDSLSLLQNVVGGNTYTCVAKNSVSNLNTSITVGEHCTEGKKNNGVALKFRPQSYPARTWRMLQAIILYYCWSILLK